jgi:hypothetical protein
MWALLRLLAVVFRVVRLHACFGIGGVAGVLWSWWNGGPEWGSFFLARLLWVLLRCARCCATVSVVVSRCGLPFLAFSSGGPHD